MTCAETLRLLSAYLDHELDAAGSLAMASHLDGCPACRRELQALTDLSGLVRGGGGYYRAPPALRRRLQARLAAETAPAKRPFPRGWSDAAGRPLAAVLALALLAFGAARLVLVPQPSERLVQDIIAGHVRSLQVDHLTDIASSDRHAVKPWFAGKLNYSPQVADFDRDGFPLVGGRLDYVRGRPVTALVYRRRQHIINVFVWPSQLDEVGADGAFDGFHLYSFQHAGMTYWLVSDLNEEELKLLAALLQRP